MPFDPRQFATNWRNLESLPEQQEGTSTARQNVRRPRDIEESHTALVGILSNAIGTVMASVMWNAHHIAASF